MKEVIIAFMLILTATSVYALESSIKIDNLIEPLEKAFEFIARAFDNEYIIYGFMLISSFLIFYSIYGAAAKKVKIFEGEGGLGLNKAGSLFVTGVTLITCLAIFAFKPQIKTAATSFLGPFGNLGGILLSGVIGLMVYRNMKDAKIFGAGRFTCAMVAVLLFAIFFSSLTGTNLWGWISLIIVILILSFIFNRMPKSPQNIVRRERRDINAARRTERRADNEQKVDLRLAKDIRNTVVKIQDQLKDTLLTSKELYYSCYYLKKNLTERISLDDIQKTTRENLNRLSQIFNLCKVLEPKYKQIESDIEELKRIDEGYEDVLKKEIDLNNIEARKEIEIKEYQEEFEETLNRVKNHINNNNSEKIASEIDDMTKEELRILKAVHDYNNDKLNIAEHIDKLNSKLLSEDTKSSHRITKIKRLIIELKGFIENENADNRNKAIELSTESFKETKNLYLFTHRMLIQNQHIINETGKFLRDNSKIYNIKDRLKKLFKKSSSEIDQEDSEIY